MQSLSIGSTIFSYRKQNSLTQEQLAGMVGVSPGAVSKWENGASLPDIALLKPLARALGVSLDTLLGFEAVLTEEDALRMKAQLTDTFLQQGYEAGTAACAVALQEYPNSVALQAIAAQLMQMYIGVEDTITEERVQQMLEDTLRLYRQVQESGDPKYVPLALFAMAGLHMGAGDYAAAEDCLRALPAEPIDPHALWPMLLLRQEKWDEAEMLSKRMLLYHSIQCSNMLHTCARVAMEQKDYAQAEFYLQSLAKLEEAYGIGLGSALLALAQLRLQTGDYTAAADAYHTYVQKLVHTPFAPYTGNPFFEKIALSVGLEGQRVVRLAMYRGMLEEGEQWAPIRDMRAYKSAQQLLRSALQADE